MPAWFAVVLATVWAGGCCVPAKTQVPAGANAATPHHAAGNTGVSNDDLLAAAQTMTASFLRFIMQKSDGSRGRTPVIMSVPLANNTPHDLDTTVWNGFFKNEMARSGLVEFADDSPASQAGRIVQIVQDEDLIAREGRMVRADYAVFGGVWQIGPDCVVVAKMIDVETGVLVWTDRHIIYK